MTVVLRNNVKPLSTFKSRSKDFMYNFDCEIIGKEYIAVPTENNLQRVSFQKAMKITVITGQVFGLNPFLGVCSENAAEIRFTVYSGRAVYTILSIIGQIAVLIFCSLKIFWDTGSSLESNSGIAFYSTNTILTILFLRVAVHWPELCRQISKMEEVDPILDKGLIWKCNVTCIVIFILAAVEHGLSDVTGVSIAIACDPDTPAYESRLRAGFDWIWHYVPYNNFYGALAKFFSIQCTFNWNYASIFIMCVGMYFTARFQQINDRIRSVKGQLSTFFFINIVRPNFWRTVRLDYTNVCHLVRQADQIVNGIVLVSYGSNLFSICFLILHTLQEGVKAPVICNVPVADRLFKGYEHVIYYLFSISFLILRSLAVSLVAASVNSTSAQTATLLYNVPSESYNIDVQRLIHHHIHGNSIALTGLNLFDVKRGMVLTIAASIVTYELVLIQFSNT